MSELTTCNYCMLRQIKANAQVEGKTITIRANNGWTDVYKHPFSVVIDNIKNVDIPGNKERNEFLVASLMELPKSCVC